MIHENGIEALAEGLVNGDIPAIWYERWNTYRDWISGGSFIDLSWQIPAGARDIFDLPSEVLKPLAGVCAKIAGNGRLSQLGEFWHYLIYHVPVGQAGFANRWPLPVHALGEDAGLFPLAVLVSGTDLAWKHFMDKGISEEIAHATLAFGGLYVRDFYQRHGRWGLSELGWLQNHVQAKIFRLGRLVFNAKSYAWPFRMYRYKATGEVIALCDGNAKYRTDGLADGTNGIHDPNAWVPDTQITDHQVFGYRISKDGRVLSQPVKLNRAVWAQVLAPGNRVVDVHIPSGSKLKAEECASSYMEAMDFFPRLYPEDDFAAFVCYSWIMDPALGEILSPYSNLAAFQREFDRLPLVGDERQTYDLVFRDPHADITHCVPSTTLQRAIIDHVKSGNRMRAAGGYVTWQEMKGRLERQKTLIRDRSALRAVKSGDDLDEG